MDKAIDIKRRAQRHIQSGNLDAALDEYEKLARAEENEPYHSVVIADLYFKKGDGAEATKRYLQAVDGYETAGLFKNGIAVCKKMVRLGLAPGVIFRRLAELHQRDGLGTEAALFFMQFADYALKSGETKNAAEALNAAFTAAPDNVGALERLADVLLADGDRDGSTATLKRAMEQYESLGMLVEASRCRTRLAGLDPSTARDTGKGPARPARPPSLPGTSAEPMVGSAAHEVFDPHDRSARVLDDEGDGGESKVAADASSHAHPQGPDADPAESAPPDAPLGLLSGSGYEPTVRNEPKAPPIESAEVVAAIAATETDADLETSDDGEEPDPLEALDSTEAEAEASPPPPTPVLSQAAPEPDDRPGLRFDPSEGGGGALDHEQLFRGLVPDAMTHPEAMKYLLEARQRLRGGALDATAESMLKVAEVHEESRNDEAAARVFRALEHLVPLTPAQLVLWFENASRRGDGREASRVACQMGERALQGGEPDFARDWFQRAISLDPACVSAEEHLRALATDVRTQASLGPATAVPDPTKLDVVYGVGEVQIPLDEIVDRFQAGVQELVSGDAESQYALGVSFLEMGLAEQAMEALRAASKSPETRGRAAELIGRCLMDLGRFEDAVNEFRASVSDASLDAGTLLAVRFELGLALEAAGRFDEALTEFELVHQAQPSYPDAANKIRSLRQSLEQR